MHRVRLGHVRRLLRDRYGLILPDDDAGIDDLRILLHVKAVCYEPERRERALAAEIELWAPWLDGKKLAAAIAAKPMRLKADTLGRMLNVDWETRERLKVWQIGAVDMPADIRATRRKRRDAERKWRQYRAEGRKTREQYVAEALSNSRPWEAEGISRRTWERRRRRVATVWADQPGAVSQVYPQSTTLPPPDTLATTYEAPSGKGAEGP